VSGFEVQARQCATCIYRKDSPLDLAQLEAQIADGYGRVQELPRLPLLGDGVLPRLLEPAQGPVSSSASLRSASGWCGSFGTTACATRRAYEVRALAR